MKNWVPDEQVSDRLKENHGERCSLCGAPNYAHHMNVEEWAAETADLHPFNIDPELLKWSKELIGCA